MRIDLPGGDAGRVAVMVDKYPCLSESFIRRELTNLASLGFKLVVLTCSPARRSDRALLPESPFNVFFPEAHSGRDHVRLAAESLRELPRALTLFPKGPRSTAAAGRAAWTAAAIRPALESWKPDWLHAHFLGMPAAAACLLSQRLNVPLSISAHARDIFVPQVDLAKLCSRARFVSTCSEHARTSLIEQLPSQLAKRVVHFSHDVECGPTVKNQEQVNGFPLRLLSVCRLVPKKGVDVILKALALLRSESECRYRYRIVGGGPELSRLKALASDLNLEDVEFVGPVSPDVVQRELAHADVFVLGARRMPDGDRDGIPNAMLEAMAAGIPVIVSDAGGVSEVIRHRSTGWLLPPNNPEAFADALREVALDHRVRRRVAASARAEVRRRFSQNGRLLALKLSSEMANS
ncbi:MAG TPA: glycosyltransferase family 4 protein [Pyrinomonadaceae bacterium]|nr:glycosyltransferase family 4 protein [Pyrinomonadaceae bacterium]